MNKKDTNTFETYRPLMRSIAYRMLGSITDAEDIIQEAYLRYQATGPAEIEHPKAFLSTVVTRLCIDHLRSAQVQRESYIGPWLPEPLLVQPSRESDPEQQLDLHESLSYAFLVLLEQLTPQERAVFLLREVFGYEYAEIAAIVELEEATCRQLLSRAKKHLADHRPRFRTTPEKHQEVLEHFIQAINTGDVSQLTQLLTEDVFLRADSDGKVRGAIINPLYGRERVVRFLLASPRLRPENSYTEIMSVNGEPALVFRSGSEVLIVITLVIEQGQVSGIYSVGNPEKLKWMSQALTGSEEINE